MAKDKANPNVERLAAAVADRFSASARAPRLGDPQVKSKKVALIDRLASAVGQRLAARSGANIDVLASAVAHRLAASPGAARLASGAARHFANELIWSEAQLDQMVGAAANEIKTG